MMTEEWTSWVQFNLKSDVVIWGNFSLHFAILSVIPSRKTQDNLVVGVITFRPIHGSISHANYTFSPTILVEVSEGK